MPGLKLTGDVSCFRTSEGWIYLATMIDLCSKELIGWAIAAHMRPASWSTRWPWRTAAA